MIHANHANTCYGTDQGVCGIAALLQQVRSDVTADVALRSHSAQLTMLDYRRCRIAWGNRIRKH